MLTFEAALYALIFVAGFFYFVSSCIRFCVYLKVHFKKKDPKS